MRLSCLLLLSLLVALGCRPTAAPATQAAALVRAPQATPPGPPVDEQAQALAARERAAADAAAARAAEVAAALDLGRGPTWYGGAVVGGEQYGGDQYGGDTPAIAAYVPAIVVPGGDPAVYQRTAVADPAVAYHVPVGGSAVDGTAAAAVTVVVGIDIATPYGPQLLRTLDELRRTYGADLRIVWKHLLSSPFSQVGALALCAAGEQGAFERFLRAVQDRRYRTSAEGLPEVDAGDVHRRYDALRAVATELKLNVSRWDRYLRSKVCHEQVVLDLRRLLMLGTTSTPAIWINGRLMLGGRPAAALTPLIDEELARARAWATTAAAGAGPYYDVAIEHGPKLVRLPRPRPEASPDPR